MSADLPRKGSAATLDEDLGLWRAFIQLLSGYEPVVRRSDPPSLRAPLEPSPEEFVGALPESVDWLPTRAQNREAYRFLCLQLAGRHEFGTYASEAIGGGAHTSAPTGIFAKLRGTRERPSALEEWFVLAEGVRVQARLELSYPGTVDDTRQLSAALLATWSSTREGEGVTHARVCDVLFACALHAPSPEAWPTHLPPCPLPAWLPASSVVQLLEWVAPLRAPGASVADSLRVARRLVAWVAREAVFLAADPHAAAYELEDAARLEPVALSELASDGTALYAALPDSAVQPGEAPEGADAPAEADAAESPTGGAAEAGTSPASAVDAANPPQPELGPAGLRRARPKQRRAQTFLYDEWDHTILGYRRAHCLVHEVELQGDSGAFFARTTRSFASVLSQVRRQFEHMRPERYRPLRGLEDGEDFDLNALTEARIEARAKRSPSTRIYTARTRQKRDVATLFLLDMSASTEQPFAEPGDPPVHRIIDTLKETLVVMCTALHALGDQYAIYGFSSQGRQAVEVYPIKRFAEALSPRVKARIGSIEPRHGTRMGAALRHVLRDFAHVQTRSKHLLLLSDGFPQDHGYGSDRRSHTYGIEDTAVALREVAQAGATPLCITVDRAGHDYLRQMCSAGEYLVIDQLEELPRELPRIYRRTVAS